MNEDHPVRLSVEYPDRPLDRLTTAFRIFTVIPIAIVLGTIGGYTGGGGYDGSGTTVAIGGTGLLFGPAPDDRLPPEVPALVVRLEPGAARFGNRVGAYFALMNDRYPSTDEQQWVRLDFPTRTPRGTSTAGCRW